MSNKTILNSSRLSAVTMLSCAVLLSSAGVAAALPTDRTPGPPVDCHVSACGPRTGPSTSPPVRDQFTGRLVDRPDRWVLRGPVIIPPY